jgi:hypothetical protein
VVVLTSLLIGGAIGYYLGASSSSQAPTSPTSPQSSVDFFAQRAPVVQELKQDDSDNDEMGAEPSASAQGLGSIKASLFEECKLVVKLLHIVLAAWTHRYTHPIWKVLVVRTDLGMTKGKIAAQCGCVLNSYHFTSLPMDYI